jgi:RNA polymerase sigma factor (sigma-70 family)
MTDQAQQPASSKARAAGPGARRLALQGDEAQLFERHHARLRRVTAATVLTSWENVDDACAFAWSQLLTSQPRRETVFAWLRQVARREAIRLDQGSLRTVHLDIDKAPELAGRARSPVAAHRSAASTQGMLEVQERLAALPQDQREIWFMRAGGWHYRDIADCLGLTEARVSKLLRRADAHVRELDQRDIAPHSARAQRLQQLEDRPPPFLLSAIGRPPRPTVKRAGEQRRLDWRRIALAIDDYRAAHNITDPDRALGTEAPAAGPCADRTGLEQRIASFMQARSRGVDRAL